MPHMQGTRADRRPPRPPGLVDRLCPVLEQRDARLLPFVRRQATAGSDCVFDTVWIMGDPFLLDYPTFGRFPGARVDNDAAWATARLEQNQLFRSVRAKSLRGVLRPYSAFCSETTGSGTRRSPNTARPSGSGLTSGSGDATGSGTRIGRRHNDYGRSARDRGTPPVRSDAILDYGLRAEQESRVLENG
jgi:hypothetical protein